LQLSQTLKCVGSAMSGLFDEIAEHEAAR
jgi:hypothetical protein